jgi:hypothetical protein
MPLDRLAATVTNQPDWVAGQTALAGLRWELGDREDYAAGFRTALAAIPANAPLWNAYIQTLAGVEDFVGAANAAAEARRVFTDPVLTLIEASNAGMAGEDARTEALLAATPETTPGRDSVAVRHLIRTCDFSGALQTLDRMRERAPTDVSVWALAELLWRHGSEARWDWLMGQPGLLSTTELPLDEQALTRLADALRSLHRQAAHPVGQSVRGGTQTRGPLFERSDPAIQHLRKQLQATVERYQERLPAADATHPLLRHRDRALRVEGGWSVRLSGAGFHVAHLHSAGVLSSAFYVAVPAFDDSEREGWLELGRPPADLRLDLDPLASVRPAPGTLALFPSYLYHGTRPFRAGERLTVAFDVA